MSRIYAAERRRDHRPVAIKVFQAPRGQELRYRDYMLHEANALRVGAGAFVVELLDHGVCMEQPFLVLEWIPGRNLGQTIAAGAPLALARVASIFRRILDAIEALHARGVIHADLKPANVMLSPHHGGERVRLVDLGASSVHGAGVARRDEVFGTPGYLAPEIAAGGSLAASSDVYSAGVLLFEMLTGTPPFSGATLEDLVAQQRRPRTPRPSRFRPFAVRSVSEAFDALLATALASSPA
ncbi:MAG: serine/threonine protein kinase, partial [Deltaproteobacteria bacterium]|nr:serine/threonine protein kinase [Kofleriaceae bacterium]